jgi:hypothetical protein
MREPDSRVYVKIKAALEVATGYEGVCDCCLIMINIGDVFAKATFNEYESCDFDTLILNCKKCLIKGD